MVPNRRPWPTTPSVTGADAVGWSHDNGNVMRLRGASLDTRASWASPDEAAKDDAFSGWTCPVCAWTEFDLVEAEREPASA